MVDSGNTTAAISLACATRLGLSWGATAPRKIATASRKKASLIVRGEIRNLCLRLEERKEPLLLQNAWIIDKLNSDVNLGVKFLQQHNVILDWTNHKGNRPVLRLPGEQNETMGTMAAAGNETTRPTEAPDVPVSKLAEVLTNPRYQKRKPVDQGGPSPKRGLGRTIPPAKLQMPESSEAGPRKGQRAHQQLADVLAKGGDLYVPGSGASELLVHCGNQDALVETVLLNITEDAMTVGTKRSGGQSMPLCRQAGMHMPGARWQATATAATMSTPGRIDRRILRT